jgi:hypothetical protein
MVGLFAPKVVTLVESYLKTGKIDTDKADKTLEKPEGKKGC